jgi:hypothetical protein
MSRGVLQTPLLGVGLAFFNQPLTPKEESLKLPVREEWLGRPALASLAIKGEKASVTLAECVMTVTMERHIVTTALQGRHGTVKEYISDGDYQIEVSASVQPYVGDPSVDGFRLVDDHYPVEELEAFIGLLNEQAAVAVQSDFLRLFGIYSAVIKSYSYEQETHSNRQAFKMTLLSDEPYEIKAQQDG